MPTASDSTPSFHAVVLAAGMGTRLAPLTDEIPKPLLPVGNVPLLGRTLEKLHEGGALGLAVNSHHLANEIHRYINSLHFKVHVSHEPLILGTAGGVKQAARGLGATSVILVNGDIYGALPVHALLSKASLGLTLAVVPRPVGVGTVGMDPSGNVVRLRGEMFGTEVSSGDYMGLAHLGAKCLDGLPEQGCLIGDWALPVLRQGGTVSTALAESDFVDIGSPAAYLAANQKWLQDQGQEEFVRMGSAVVIRSVIGAGVHVQGEGVIEDCVLLPGAQVNAPLRQAVVTPSGRVVLV